MDFGEVIAHHILDHPIHPLFRIGSLQINLTQHILMMWIASAIMIVMGLAARRSLGTVPGGVANFMESLVVYIRDEVVRPNLGADSDEYMPYFLTLFFFIIICGLLGLVPWGSTATGNISVTASLAILTFLLINFSGIKKHGVLHYIHNFIPHGLPWWLAPMMLFLEIIGLVTRCFALCIRLFANMIAGHIVILAFFGLIFIFGTLWVAPASILAAVGLGLLEIFVVLLQAYIFTLLTAVFVGGAVNPQH
jgi:F-type H+-transporting ATPase subunit a